MRGVYTKSFELHQGGRSEDLQELTQVSDRGERTQPAQGQFEEGVYTLG
ncbi:addiction module toxin RelE [Citrobacter sp. TSA-1]|nr:addiction module toxin RelE [Citrobacter sp. TSA-1]